MTRMDTAVGALDRPFAWPRVTQLLKDAVPFPERIGWQMLRTLMASDKTLSDICKEVGGSERTWTKRLLDPASMKMRPISDWFFAFGLRAQVRLTPKERTT